MKKTFSFSLTFLLFCSQFNFAHGEFSSTTSSPNNHPKRRYHYCEKNAIGFRAGWGGGPWGLTYRKVTSSCSAFEFVAGWSPKETRYAMNLTPLQHGNTFLSASWAPFIFGQQDGLGVSMYGDFGIRARFHNYRRVYPVSDGGTNLLITPDFIAGLGLQVDVNDSVELFGDLHMNYTNAFWGYYHPGIESGVGIRFVLN